jgi:hypothetical protein
MIILYLSTKYHLTYHLAKNRILNLPYNNHSPSRASFKTSQLQYEAKTIALLNGQKDKIKKTGSFTTSNSGGKEYT